MVVILEVSDRWLLFSFTKFHDSTTELVGQWSPATPWKFNKTGDGTYLEWYKAQASAYRQLVVSLSSACISAYVLVQAVAMMSFY